MRPAGNVRRALQVAAETLATPQRAPTMRELAFHAGVPPESARRTVDHMRRSGHLVPVRPRHVAYRARPVMEWATPSVMQRLGLGCIGLAQAMSAWAAPAGLESIG